MTKLSESEHKDAIRDLMYMYCYRMDAGEFDAWAELFTVDGVFEPAPDQECHGRVAIRDYIGSVLSDKGDGPSRKHLTINPVITLAGDEANAISNVLVVLGFGNDISIGLAGRYEDHVIFQGGNWRFKRRKVHFDIVGNLGLKK